MKCILMIVRVVVIWVAFANPIFATSWHEIAQNVLDNLYKASSDFRFPKPSLAFTSAKQDVAYFFPSKNTLVIEEETFGVCGRLGKDSINGLAFIIGHELAHMYQEEMRIRDFTSSFLTYDKGIHARIRTEKQADIQGAFNAYIAGYKISGVIPQLIDQLYIAYNLKGSALEGYPTLEERKSTSKEVADIVEDLILLYDTAPFFSIIGTYEYASAAYEFIGQYYRGGEVLNNLGINCLIEAVNLTDYNLDRFAFPMEFNSETRLKKPKVLYGAKDFDLAAFTRRIQLIEKGKKNFEEAIQQDKNNPSALLNLATSYVLLGKYKEAQNILKTSVWPLHLKFKAQILESIILYDIDETNKQTAIRILQQIQKEGSISDIQLAQLNLQIMLENVNTTPEPENCEFVKPLSRYVFNNMDTKQIGLNSTDVSTIDYVLLNGEVHVRINSMSGKGLTLSRYTTKDESKTYNINKSGGIYSFENGFMTHCPSQRQIAVFDRKGVIKQRILYQGN
jgi:tetratricopeptide (TPR) repeat protein